MYQLSLGMFQPIENLHQGLLNPHRTAALEQCWAVWGTVTPSYWPETVIASPVIPNKDGIATDSCFTLIGAHQCGVLMGVLGCLVGCLCINHQCKHWWFNKGRQLGRLQTVPGCQGVGLYHTVRQYRQITVCGSTMFCLGDCGGDYWFPANTMKRPSSTLLSTAIVQQSE